METSEVPVLATETRSTLPSRSTITFTSTQVAFCSSGRSLRSGPRARPRPPPRSSHPSPRMAPSPPGLPSGVPGSPGLLLSGPSAGCWPGLFQLFSALVKRESTFGSLGFSGCGLGFGLGFLGFTTSTSLFSSVATFSCSSGTTGAALCCPPGSGVGVLPPPSSVVPKSAMATSTISSGNGGSNCFSPTKRKRISSSACTTRVVIRLVARSRRSCG